MDDIFLLGCEIESAIEVHLNKMQYRKFEHTHIQIAIEETCIQKQTHTHRDMHMYTHTIRAEIESINTTKIIGIIIDSQNN